MALVRDKHEGRVSWIRIDSHIDDKLSDPRISDARKDRIRANLAALGSDAAFLRQLNEYADHLAGSAAANVAASQNGAVPHPVFRFQAICTSSGTPARGQLSSVLKDTQTRANVTSFYSSSQGGMFKRTAEAGKGANFSLSFNNPLDKSPEKEYRRNILRKMMLGTLHIGARRAVQTHEELYEGKCQYCFDSTGTAVVETCEHFFSTCAEARAYNRATFGRICDWLSRRFPDSSPWDIHDWTSVSDAADPLNIGPAGAFGVYPTALPDQLLAAGVPKPKVKQVAANLVAFVQVRALHRYKVKYPSTGRPSEADIPAAGSAPNAQPPPPQASPSIPSSPAPSQPPVQALQAPPTPTPLSQPSPLSPPTPLCSSTASPVSVPGHLDVAQPPGPCAASLPFLATPQAREEEDSDCSARLGPRKRGPGPSKNTTRDPCLHTRKAPPRPSRKRPQVSPPSLAVMLPRSALTPTDPAPSPLSARPWDVNEFDAPAQVFSLRHSHLAAESVILDLSPLPLPDSSPCLLVPPRKLARSMASNHPPASAQAAARTCSAPPPAQLRPPPPPLPSRLATSDHPLKRAERKRAASPTSPGRRHPRAPAPTSSPGTLAATVAPGTSPSPPPPTLLPHRSKRLVAHPDDGRLIQRPKTSDPR
jgi:hypothetical protein